jgi:hypothetical protein
VPTLAIPDLLVWRIQSARVDLSLPEGEGQALAAARGPGWSAVRLGERRMIPSLRRRALVDAGLAVWRNRIARNPQVVMPIPSPADLRPKRRDGETGALVDVSA